MKADDRRYKKHPAPTPEDTSFWPVPDQPVTPGFIVLVGRLLYGHAWSTPLAERLGFHRGRPLSPSMLSHYVTSVRSIPDWVRPALLSVLDEGCSDLLRRAKELSEIVDRMRYGHDLEAGDIRLLEEAERAAEGIDECQDEDG